MKPLGEKELRNEGNRGEVLVPHQTLWWKRSGGNNTQIKRNHFRKRGVLERGQC